MLLTLGRKDFTSLVQETLQVHLLKMWTVNQEGLRAEEAATGRLGGAALSFWKRCKKVSVGGIALSILQNQVKVALGRGSVS